LILLVSFAFLGCNSKPPACDAPEVKEKVAQTIEQIVAESGLYAECIQPGLSNLAILGGSNIRKMNQLIGQVDEACKKGDKDACNVLQCINKMLNANNYKLIEVKYEDEGRMCAVLEGDDIAFKYKLTKTSDGFLYEPMLF